jgi:glycosyltransferase involved in cell wall biosynthesis
MGPAVTARPTEGAIRVLRVYHGGRNPAHRERERALAGLGVELTLIVPTAWSEGGGEEKLSAESYPIVELPAGRSGDVNRHAYTSPRALARLISERNPDVLDVHEEPFSVSARQVLGAAPAELPVVMYTAQNVDKRYPPPFSLYERRAYRRAAALYPCSRQAAAVARGKGFAGGIEVLPLGYDQRVFSEGTQSLDDNELALALVGRLVPEKGVRDAVHVLARVNAVRPARLVLVGAGPEEGPARALAEQLGVAERVELVPWQAAAKLAELYRRAHLVLVPSTPTATWTEQFGRVIVEAQACGAVVAGYANGSIPEVAGDAAVLVPGDDTALAERVLRLLGERAEYARLRQQGLALSRTRTWAEVARRQAELYRRAAAGEIGRTRLPPSPRERRALARAEFGPTAPTTEGVRPFALPLLRRGGMVASILGGLIDATSEVAAQSKRAASGR